VSGRRAPVGSTLTRGQDKQARVRSSSEPSGTQT
jgi:hypothetical protein